VSAAIVSGFTTGAAPAAPPAADEADPPPLSEILARATEHRDTHVLKFAEAIAREHALRPDPAYLLAANHVIEQLPPW
jgi:hypothetical protein